MAKSKNNRKGRKKKIAHKKLMEKHANHKKAVDNKKLMDKLQKKYQENYEEQIKNELERRDIENKKKISDAKKLATTEYKSPVHDEDLFGGVTKVIN